MIHFEPHPEKSKPNWDPISLAYVDHLLKNKKHHLLHQHQNQHPAPSQPQHQVTPLTYQRKTEQMFTETLNPESFWTLSTGTVVELKMKELAINCTHEQ